MKPATKYVVFAGRIDPNTSRAPGRSLPVGALTRAATACPQHILGARSQLSAAATALRDENSVCP